MIRAGSELRGPLRERADVVVIGSGAGGGFAAWELANAGLRVVLIERGAREEHHTFGQSVRQSFSAMYEDAGLTAAMGKPGIPVAYGRTLGGTTVINGGTALRAPAHVLNGWVRDHGLRGWDYDSLTPYYDKIAAVMDIGPVESRNINGADRKVLEGALALGYSAKPLNRTAKGCAGCGVCNLGCPLSAKKSMLNTTIPMADKLGARIYTEFEALNLIHRKGRAAGVRGRIRAGKGGSGGHEFVINAPVVILAGGAVGSPVFLLNNKLANGSGQVGENLHIHPVAAVLAYFDEDINGHNGVQQSVCIDEFVEEGLYFAGGFAPLALTAPAFRTVGPKQHELMNRFAKLAMFGGMIADTSVGKVRSAPGMKASLSYNLNEVDRGRLLRAIDILAKVFFRAGAREVYLPLHHTGLMTSIGQVRALLDQDPPAAELDLSAYHLMGTCRAGSNPETSVVDRNCQSHEIPGLFVADSSVLPTAPGVNPQITVMTAGLKAASFILENQSDFF